MKKSKIILFIITILLCGVLLFATCKKANAASGANQSEIIVGSTTQASGNQWDDYVFIFNLPMVYYTPGYYYYIANSWNTSQLVKVYFGEGSITINAYNYVDTTSYTLNYLDQINNHNLVIDYVDYVTNHYPTNLLLIVSKTNSYSATTGQVTAGGRIQIDLATYDTNLNLFLPVRNVNDNNYTPIYTNTTGSSGSYFNALKLKCSYNDRTTYPDAATSTNDIYDYLKGFINVKTSRHALDINDTLYYLNNNLFFVSFYQWGLRAIAGDYYDEGYSDGYAAGQENGFDDGYDTGYGEGYDEGYNLGYEDGIEGETLFSPAFRMISDIFVAIGSIMSIELVPHIPIGLLILVPLFFSVLGLILWIWRRN